MNGGYSLTYNEARKILHPNTTLTALAEIEYYAGFNGEEAKRKMVDEACLVACEALDIVSKLSICINCENFSHLDNEEDTVCLAGAGLVCKENQGCIYFKHKLNQT